MNGPLQVGRGSQDRAGAQDPEGDQFDPPEHPRPRAKREAVPREQLRFLRSALQRTAIQKRAMERQLLNIETALQIKNQAEAHAEFATAMNSLSRSISEMFGATDFTRTQKEFERAMLRAKTMEERADLFLESSSSSLFGYEGTTDYLVTDEEIDRMIEDEVVAEESRSELDEAIDEGLAAVRKELGRD
jgi:phage shock protein A